MGAKANNDNNMASELKASEPDSSNNDNEMPMEPTSPPRLRKENSHEHNIATTTATTWPTEGVQQPRQPPSLRSEQRPPSRRTTSTRSPDDSNEHNNNVRNEEIDYDVIEPRPETIRPTPDQFRAATKTSTTMDHSVRLFRFLLVVLSIFLASPQGTTNFCDTGSNPSSATFFSPSVVNELSLSLVRSFDRKTD